VLPAGMAQTPFKPKSYPAKVPPTSTALAMNASGLCLKAGKTTPTACTARFDESAQRLSIRSRTACQMKHDDTAARLKAAHTWTASMCGSVVLMSSGK
jgi:hypothetical protein